MNWYKINKVLGLSDEGLEKLKDFFFNISCFNIKLSKDEKDLCTSCGIDNNLAKILKAQNTSEIIKLPSINDGEMDFDNTSDGVCALYCNDVNSIQDIERIVCRNKQKYLKKGYNLFYFEGNRYTEIYMALAPKQSDNDILQWSKVNGINYDIDNDAVIAKISEWQQRYDFVLGGCGRDWLHIFFTHREPSYNHQLGASNSKYNQRYKLWKERTPKFKDFASEVITFCPDTIIQIHSSKAELVQSMAQSNSLYLWWD